MESIKKALVYVFKKINQREVDRDQFIFQVPSILNGFKPEDTERLLNVSLNGNLLCDGDEGYRLNFDPRGYPVQLGEKFEVSILDGFSDEKINSRSIEKTGKKKTGEKVPHTCAPSGEESPNLLLGIVDRIAQVKGEKRRDVMVRLNALKLNAEIEIKALMLAKKYDIHFDDLLPRVEKELRKRFNPEDMEKV